MLSQLRLSVANTVGNRNRAKQRQLGDFPHTGDVGFRRYNLKNRPIVESSRVEQAPPRSEYTVYTILGQTSRCSPGK